MAGKVRVRIAPSPTGSLHVGTARTALYNYLFAKRHGGDFIMRLEDTDEARSSETHTEDIVSGLKWLGLHWDEGPDVGGPYAPYRQTEKVDHYEDIANHLISKGKAYLCYCTAEELDQLKEEQRQTVRTPRYDNRCRHLPPEKLEQYEAQGRVPAIRFKVEEPRVVSWTDGIKGEITIDTSDLGGDMVIVKSNGVAIYNFAVVVDDVDMKMTHVIRGEDHIHNTAKQILLYEALDKTLPHFAHVPLIFDIERRKLSKRLHGESVHIDRYRADGYMPEAMVNYLAQMSWSPPDGQELFSLDEAGKMFDLARVSTSPAVFDVQKLNWFNGHYLRSLPLELITDRAIPYLPEDALEHYERKDLEKVIDSVREGLTVLSQAFEASLLFFQPMPIAVDLQDTLMSTEAARTVLNAFLASIASMPWGDHKGCKAVVDNMGKELGLKGKDLYWPLRVALSGKTQGPDLGAIISILGEARVRSRIESALQLCHQV